MVTRQDLSPGQQATQSAHAAFLFATEHPALTEQWFRESSYLVLLSVADENALLMVGVALERADLVLSSWMEPDMGDETTAIAVAPSPTAMRLLANLPLTLREPAMT